MLFSLLRELSEAFGPAGFEDEIRSIIRCHIERVVDSVEVTPLGNLIARKRGSNARHTLMMDAHMDEVGFMVTVVEPSGFLRFAPLGGWDARVIPGHRMTIRATDGSKHLAVVGSTPPHATSAADRDRPLSIDQLYLDVACPDAAAVEALGIRMGSPVVPCTPYVEMGNDAVCGKAFD
ncbi:TPA: peptidase M42, partial [Candidatus Sumerlaeota bacterium]|nr:peptidase M42 [Candidatus Sumerlaeota bacterium]